MLGVHLFSACHNNANFSKSVKQKKWFYLFQCLLTLVLNAPPSGGLSIVFFPQSTVLLSLPSSPLNSPLLLQQFMASALRRRLLTGLRHCKCKASGGVKWALATSRCLWCWHHGDASGADGADVACLLCVNLHPHNGSCRLACHNMCSKHGNKESIRIHNHQLTA
jgi:hypothetical protein